MTDLKLLNCPFCGGEVEIWELKALAGNILYEVICHHCKTRKGAAKTEKIAIKEWNTRTKSEADKKICQEFDVKYEKLLTILRKVANTDLVYSDLDIEANELLKEIGE